MNRVGLIGCGSISTVHAHVLSELENTELAACADLIPERAKRYGCAAYTDWKEMLDSAQLDAVHDGQAAVHAIDRQQHQPRQVAGLPDEPGQGEGQDEGDADAHRTHVDIIRQRDLPLEEFGELLDVLILLFHISGKDNHFFHFPCIF